MYFEAPIFLPVFSVSPHCLCPNFFGGSIKGIVYHENSLSMGNKALRNKVKCYLPKITCKMFTQRHRTTKKH